MCPTGGGTKASGKCLNLLNDARRAAEALVRAEPPVGLPGLADVPERPWTCSAARLTALQTAAGDVAQLALVLESQSGALLRLSTTLGAAEMEYDAARAAGARVKMREGAELLDAGNALFADEARTFARLAGLMERLATEFASSAAQLTNTAPPASVPGQRNGSTSAAGRCSPEF